MQLAVRRVGIVGGIATCLLGAAAVIKTMRQSALEWGDAFVDQPIERAPDHPYLDVPLVFQIDDILVDQPSVIDTPLTAHAQWWRGAAMPKLALSATLPGGIRRAMLISESTQHSDVRFRSDAFALPVACPDPSVNRLCYHAGRMARNGIGQAHLGIIIEQIGDGPAPEIEVTTYFLGLLDSMATFRAHGGPLVGLDRTSIDHAMRLLAEGADAELDPLGAPDATYWAVAGHATGSYLSGRSMWYRPDDRDVDKSFVMRWRQSLLRQANRSCDSTPTDRKSCPSTARSHAR